MTSIPESLQTQLKLHNVVPVIGARVTQSVLKTPKTELFDSNGHTVGYESLFPNWKEFFEIVADKLVDKGKINDSEVVKECINLSPAKYIQASELASRKLGKNLWYQLLRESFEKPQSRAEKSSLELAKSIWQLGSSFLITTNVDRTLQWTCPYPNEFQRLDTQTIKLAPLQYEPNFVHPTVWYMHGSIDNPKNIITSPNIKDGFQNQKDAKKGLAFLTTLLLKRDFLFIGYEDEDEIREQVEFLRELAPNTSSVFYILLEESNTQKMKLPHYLNVITFKDYGESLLNLMNELSAFANDGSSEHSANTTNLNNASLNKIHMPWYQRTIKALAIAFGAYFLFGGIFDSIVNTITLFTLDRAYVFTGLVIIFVLVSEVFLRISPLDWVAGSRIIKINKLGKTGYIYASAFLFLIWSSLLINFFMSGNQPVSNLETSNNEILQSANNLSLQTANTNSISNNNNTTGNIANYSNSNQETKQTLKTEKELPSINSKIKSNKMTQNLPQTQKSSPGSKEQSISLANSLFRQGRDEEALKECDRILRINPQNKQALNLKKQILKAMQILNP